MANYLVTGAADFIWSGDRNSFRICTMPRPSRTSSTSSRMSSLRGRIR